MSPSIPVPRSVHASRRGNVQREQYSGKHGAQSDKLMEDKFAVPNVTLQRASGGLEGDSVRYPVLDTGNPEKLAMLIDASFGNDFGRDFFEGDHSTALSWGTSALNSEYQSTLDYGNGQAPPLPNSVPDNIYDLDDSQRRRHNFLSRGEAGKVVEEVERQSSNPHFTEQLQANDTGRRMRAPLIGRHNGDQPDNTVLKDPPGADNRSRRPFSGISIRSMTATFSRGLEAGTGMARHQQVTKDGHVHAASKTSNPLVREGEQRREFHVPSPLDSMIKYHSQFTQKQPRAMVSTPSLPQVMSPSSPAVPKPWTTRRPSASSLRSTMSIVNKPLPPEPSQFDIVHQSHAPLASQRPITPLRNLRGRDDSLSSSASNQFLQAAKKDNTTPALEARSASGRTRFTPRDVKDLDALDDVFQRSTLSQPTNNTSFLVSHSPVSGEVLAYEHRELGPITGSPRESTQFNINKPSHISRGPMRMEPSRRPPPTPGSRGRSPAPAEAIPSAPQQTTQKRSMNNNPQSRGDAQMDALLRMERSQSAVQVCEPISMADTRMDTTSMQLEGGGTKAQRFSSQDESLEDLVNERGSIVYRQIIHSKEVLPDLNNNQEFNPSRRNDSLVSPSGAFRPTGGDSQFHEIRRRLELLSPASGNDNSFMNSHIFGQMLSNQLQRQDSQAIPAEHEHRGDAGEEQRDDDQDDEKENVVIASARPMSMSPVELPGDPKWPMPSIVAHGTAADSSPRVSVQPATPFPGAPPPIPMSPQHKGYQSHDFKRQSMLSSGTGRTKSIRSVRSARSARSVKARSLSSLAVSEIQELYAGLPSPRTTIASRRPSTTIEEEDVPELPPMPEIATTEDLEELDVISADTAEQVLYQILRNLHEPQDLFNASLVSRGFQRTFRRHDTKLLRNSLWYTSPPAWEYLEMHMPISAETGQLEYPPDIYRLQFVRDMLCMTKLKAMILRHCSSSLSPNTALLMNSKSALGSAAVDNAIWRIWTFCKIFGDDEERREDLEMQKRWINGQTIAEVKAQGAHRGSITMQDYPAFGFGNDEGLTPAELMRMGEIWMYLKILVRGYRGQRREAREYGIFDGADVLRGDSARENDLLDQWSTHLLSLAPGTNLEVLAPVKAVQENFIIAESLGFTSWTPPGRNFTASGFLTGPICTVLEEWLARDAHASFHPLRDSNAQSVATDTEQSWPSRQQIGMFVDRLRSGKEMSMKAVPEPKPAIVRHESSTSMARSQASSKASQATSAGPTNSIGEPTKKSSFSLGSKLSLRLHARAPTSSSKPKLPPLPTKAISPTPSIVEEGPSSPISGTSSSRFDIFRKKTQQAKRTIATSGSGDSGDNGSRPANELISASMEQSSRMTPSTSRSASIVASQEKFPVLDDTPGMAADPSSVTPFGLATERLVAMGYDPIRVRKTLSETSRNEKIDFDRALNKLKKSKRLEERLKRLDRMG